MQAIYGLISIQTQETVLSGSFNSGDALIEAVFFALFAFCIDSKSKNKKYTSVNINTYLIYNVTLRKLKDTWGVGQSHFFTQDCNKTFKAFFLQQWLL